MQEKQILARCPHCQETYALPATLVGRPAKCWKCHQVFVVQAVQRQMAAHPVANGDAPADSGQSPVQTRPPTEDRAGEDTILNWLEDEDDDDQAEQEELRKELAEQAARLSQQPPSTTSFVGKTKNLYLQNVDQKGAYFWFSSKLLLDKQFRASFPQVCARCLTDRHLRIHLIHWPSKMTAKHLAKIELLTRPVGRVDELPKGDPVYLLTYLAKQDYLPEPYNLPFPYYVCENCSPIGLISTGTSATATEERCWLSVATLDVAAQFFASNCGTGDDDYHRLRVHSELSGEDRWSALSTSVRSRLTTWYKPGKGEHFIEYIPYETFKASTDGEAGLVITDRRMVYHVGRQWREYPLTESITVTTQSAPEGMKVEIYTLNHGRAVLKLDSRSWANMKHYLKALQARIRFVG